jgi:uncharacterized protein YbjT (DUF2867 family)
MSCEACANPVEDLSSNAGAPSVRTTPRPPSCTVWSPGCAAFEFSSRPDRNAGPMADEILITGARGAVGRAALVALVRSGTQVRALVRHPDPADMPDGVTSVVGDLTRPASLIPALQGVRAMLLLVVEGEDVAEVVAAAKQCGVRRVVLISSGGVRDNAARQSDPLMERHAQAERAVEASGLEWVILRPRWLCRNALWWAAAVRAGRPVRLAYPAAVTAPVHERDIAEVAAAELVAHRVRPARRVLTGPQILTQAEQIRIIGAEIGVSTCWEAVAPDTWRQELLEFIPVVVLDVLLHQQATLTAAQIRLSTQTQRTLGRPGLSFGNWVRDHRDAFLNRPTAP